MHKNIIIEPNGNVIYLQQLKTHFDYFKDVLINKGSNSIFREDMLNAVNTDIKSMEYLHTYYMAAIYGYITGYIMISMHNRLGLRLVENFRSINDAQAITLLNILYESNIYDIEIDFMKIIDNDKITYTTKLLTSDEFAESL
jgi:hypothetical protein